MFVLSIKPRQSKYFTAEWPHSSHEDINLSAYKWNCVVTVVLRSPLLFSSPLRGSCWMRSVIVQTSTLLS